MSIYVHLQTLYCVYPLQHNGRHGFTARTESVLKADFKWKSSSSMKTNRRVFTLRPTLFARVLDFKDKKLFQTGDANI